MEKLNKTFVSNQILTAVEMNLISLKIDELVDKSNEQDSQIGEITTLLDELNGEVI